jgi:hypothetical protein
MHQEMAFQALEQGLATDKFGLVMPKAASPTNLQKTRTPWFQAQH